MDENMHHHCNAHHSHIVILLAEKILGAPLFAVPSITTQSTATVRQLQRTTLSTSVAQNGGKTIKQSSQRVPMYYAIISIYTQ